MNGKQVTSLVALVVGVFLIGYGFYLRNTVSGAESEIKNLGKSKNPIVKTVGKDMQVKVGQHSKKVKWCIFGGIVLVVIGGAAAFLSRKKHHHRS